jgi:hypothetical protein
MGLFDIFSGSDEAEEAAAKNAALYQQYGVNTSNLYNQYKTGATDALTGAKTAAVGALGTGLTNTLGALNTGLQGSLAAGNAGVAAYNPLSKLGDNYGTAVNRYYDTLGLNGPDAARNAQAQYVADPGQQYQIDEATRAAINAASRTGAVGGGSTAQGIGRDVLGIVNKNYGAYQDRLAGFVNPQLAATQGAATGVAGANKTLADIYSQGYGAQAGAYGANASQQAGLESGYGSDVSNVLGNYTAGQGQTLKDITAGNAASNQAIAQAGQTDASNLWGLLGAGVKAAGAGFGGGLGK